MLFNSWQFLLFFPVVTGLYFALPHGGRWLLLLAASCVFYAAFIPSYLLILGFTILVDYTAGLLIADSQGRRRKTFLLASIFSNLMILGFFKYFNFFDQSVDALAGLLDWNYSPHLLAIALPIGLSFHIFQSLSYVIEVYRGQQAPERHLGIFALYVMFYPQLVAGPIERPQNMLHQFRQRHTFDNANLTAGLKRMAWGMFKKVVIADRLALLVNPIFAEPSAHTGLTLIAAVVLFAFQIYCDFSGYSDIALGAARVMGFNLMENFKRPYAARSIAEFWTRWHISLSTWFKDYVYIPLGGNRVSRPRWALNIMTVFMISGLWHGANWTFVLWGALHGLYLLAFQWGAPLASRLAAWTGLARWPKAQAAAQVGLTFSLVCFAWIFFRATRLNDALYMSTHLFTNLPAQLASVAAFKAALAPLDATFAQLAIALCAIGVMEIVHLVQSQELLRQRFLAAPVWLRWSVYQSLLLSLIFFGAYQSQTFIYFQF